jgi:hypothetical protein
VLHRLARVVRILLASSANVSMDQAHSLAGFLIYGCARSLRAYFRAVLLTMVDTGLFFSLRLAEIGKA